LSRFNFTLKHIPGVRIRKADGLSVIRRECGQTLGRVRVRTDIGQQ